MLPFMKLKNEAAANADDEPTKLGEHDYEMIDAIAEDMMEAFQKKDKGLLRSAIEALCEYIKDEDESQDDELQPDSEDL